MRVGARAFLGLLCDAIALSYVGLPELRFACFGLHKFSKCFSLAATAHNEAA